LLKINKLIIASDMVRQLIVTSGGPSFVLAGKTRIAIHIRICVILKITSIKSRDVNTII